VSIDGLTSPQLLPGGDMIVLDGFSDIFEHGREIEDLHIER
jgi:hypothetical protein